MELRFSDITAPRPDREGLAARYEALNAALAQAPEVTLREWDALRREVDGWMALAHLRFAQDTTDAEAKAEREYADALAPVVQGHETAMKRRVLEEVDLALVAEICGAHTPALWRCDITTFAPEIAADLEEEAKLSARYTALLAGAKLQVGGEEVNLSGLAPHAEHPDRERRHEAEAARWSFFAQHGEELDAIYDALVKLRHGMARKLGDDSFTALAYRRMRRLDYGPTEVARYREEIVARVVPLVTELLEARRAAHGWDRLRFWDEALIDPAGNPAPLGDHDTLLDAAQAMFDGMDKRLADFFRGMAAGGFLDLKNRPGKAGGGFCTSFPSQGAPFIFANFNGTHHDIGVFTHEMGHAFQCWQSRALPGVDQLWPGMESAEIHSMGLEFLTHPGIHHLVGEDAAERFRRMHLISSLAFLPYGACVDHFQHEVYANPNATPAERHAIWQRLERLYMPWTDYGDLEYPAKGGRWQAKQHIYNAPFYYIDYALALCCAMQFWQRSRRDAPAALEAYVALCGRGGSLPFSGLVDSAGLASPFAPGALAVVVEEARAVLG
ncbi:M3 family oligoendopeptidase [Roseococcus thiosulfatophilus]|uniref:M3 family oligoendopeptidase n=1 Tax=Roseococcus thiosulfatophilus TaxID=35813 RepID=UPI001A907BCA|nr:M3 family oligoendopeptidase [Roseococcus thiosulfatophilus]